MQASLHIVILKGNSISTKLLSPSYQRSNPQIQETLFSSYQTESHCYVYLLIQQLFIEHLPFVKKLARIYGFNVQQGEHCLCATFLLSTKVLMFCTFLFISRQCVKTPWFHFEF